MTDPGPRMRAADTDRQAAVDRLTGHFTAGRLTASEFDDRVRQAYASTYLDELPLLLADLPDDARWGEGGFTAVGDQRGSAGWIGDEEPAGSGGDGPSWPGARGWAGGPRGYGDRPPWWDGRRGFRHRPRFAALPVVVVVVLLIALSHGFVLIPLFWVGLALFVFGRHRHGGCGRRIGPRSVR